MAATYFRRPSAAGLSQGQLRALRFRPGPPTRRDTAPSETVFARVLAALDHDALQTARLRLAGLALATFSVFSTECRPFLSCQRNLEQSRARNNACGLFQVQDIPSDNTARGSTLVMSCAARRCIIMGTITIIATRI